MKKRAIDEALEMTEKLLSGAMDAMNYQLDFPYFITKNYKKMCREDAEYADLIYVLLVENGTDFGDGMADKDFLKLMKRQYNDVLQGVW